MTHTHKRALFIFRQDLRTIDNTWLRKAIALAKEVVPVFIVDTTILENFPDKDQRLWFLLDALRAVKQQLQEAWSTLYVYHGKSVDLIPALVDQRWCDSLVWNKSYGQNARDRDTKVQDWAALHDVDFYATSDYLLVEPEAVEQRKVFTPFYKLWMNVPKKRQPEPAPKQINTPLSSVQNVQWAFLDLNESRQAILERIGWKDQSIWDVAWWRKIIQSLDVTDYKEERNFPGIHGTSKLSPHLAFGTVSIREIFHQVLSLEQPWVLFDEETKTVTMNKKIFVHTYISELAWREFWQHIAFYFPESWECEFLEKRRWLARVNNKERFEHRKDWTTWYPIVDAAMKQLKAEQWMHWRCRMIVASFLTKDLLIDRRRWEEHFKNYLLDYDKAVNMGNRQRSASVWADPKPLRIFSPLLQSKRYDPDAIYIKKWLPELEGQPLNAIHDPLKYDLDYIKPIVDHSVMQRIAKQMYKHESIDDAISCL